MGYRALPNPPIHIYPPIEKERKNRKGAEEEYSISGPTGIYEKVTDTREVMEPVPNNLLKPLMVQSHKFVVPHPSLKTFAPFLEVDETDPEFALRPTKNKFQDSLDPTSEANYDVLKREFLASTAGMEGSR
mmetsp:Transcript_10635/g.9211  ORF Transcript_10635/g.9211 Transcript_10635/m.9211 type:complete len:131 (+) Transcript_10635:1299-1691(+)